MQDMSKGNFVKATNYFLHLFNMFKKEHKNMLKKEHKNMFKKNTQKKHGKFCKKKKRMKIQTDKYIIKDNKP